MSWWRFIFTYGERGFWDWAAVCVALALVVVILTSVIVSLSFFGIFYPWLAVVHINLAVILILTFLFRA